MGRIYRGVWGVDKWSCEQNMNKNSNYEQIVNKSLFLILLQFPGNLLFYWGFKPSDLTQSPLYQADRIRSTLSPAASPDRLAKPGGIPQFYRRGKQQNNEIAARIGGIAKTTSYLTIPKNHIATSPPHPPQIPLPHHTSIRNPPILHTPPLSRQTNHFEKTKKSRR